MESTLSSLAGFIPSPTKEVGRIVETKFQSSFYGTVICAHSSSVAMNYNNNISSGNRSSLVISFVFVFWRLGKKIKKETVVPEPDYRIPMVLLGFAGGLVYADNLSAAAPLGLLGLLLLVQTPRVRFVFDEEALEVKIGEQLEESGENVFVGGKTVGKWEATLRCYGGTLWPFTN